MTILFCFRLQKYEESCFPHIEKQEKIHGLSYDAAVEHFLFICFLDIGRRCHAKSLLETLGEIARLGEAHHIHHLGDGEFSLS